MPSLEAILTATAETLPAARQRRRELERAVMQMGPAPDFQAGLRHGSVALIAEVKRRSPSAGAINEALDPATLATSYSAGGAAAISVLTDAPFFGGSMQDLREVVAAVAIPVLRKDFILDEVQLLEARAEGAAAALLIVRALDDRTLVQLLRFAGSIGLTALVETHDSGEISRAVDAGATVIGVNARDLDTFAVDTAAAWRLIPAIPRGVIAVAESGMATVDDVMAAAAAGADAVLIGSALARSGQPAEQAQLLSGIPRRGR